MAAAAAADLVVATLVDEVTGCTGQIGY